MVAETSSDCTCVNFTSQQASMAASMDQVIVNSLKEGLLAQKSEQMPSDSDDQPSSSTFTRTVSRFSTRRGSSRLLSRRASGSASVSPNFIQQTSGSQQGSALAGLLRV